MKTNSIVFVFCACMTFQSFAMYARADSDLLRAIKYGATAQLTVKIGAVATRPSRTTVRDSFLGRQRGIVPVGAMQS